MVPIGTEEEEHRIPGSQLRALYPTSELARALSTADDRIEVLPVSALSEGTTGAEHVYNTGRATAADYRVMVGIPMAQRLSEYLQQQGLSRNDVLIRTSPVSLNGGISAPRHDLYVRDIRHACARGSDRYPDDIVTVAGFGVETGIQELHDHVNSAAHSQPTSLRERLAAAGEGNRARGIFPVLFVYDRKKLNYIGGYTAQVVDSSAVMKAYILPVLQ